MGISHVSVLRLPNAILIRASGQVDWVLRPPHDQVKSLLEKIST